VNRLLHTLEKSHPEAAQWRQVQVSISANCPLRRHAMRYDASGAWLAESRSLIQANLVWRVHAQRKSDSGARKKLLQYLLCLVALKDKRGS
jgi:hypothetical protein